MPFTLAFNLQKAGDSVIHRGFTNSAITVTKLGLLAQTAKAVAVTIKDGATPIGRAIQAGAPQEFPALVPLTLGSGNPLVLSADSDALFSGFIEYDLS